MDRQQREQLLIDVLDRQVPFESLSALVGALRPTSTAISTTQIAFGLDANVFLRLSSHARSADIIDYFRSAHVAPLILPGQVIQEFWNNQLGAVETSSISLKKKFIDLSNTLRSFGESIDDFLAEVDVLLDSYEASYGHIYDEALVRKTLSLLELLQEKASVPYVQRLKFQALANQRKRTKTPPGFEDNGDGDFYVWIDFLAGLQQAKIEGRAFAKVVLVSNEKKKDWCRAGIAHPILVAEIKCLLDVPFEIWDLSKLAKEIA